jgi:trypsin
VLTAAHCDNSNTLSPSVYFRNVERQHQDSVVRTIVDHVAHPNFNAALSTRDFDYLILKLDRTALQDIRGEPTGVKAIAINIDPNIPATNDALWGIGYGQIGEDISGMSNELREATIYAFDNTQCDSQYGQFFDPADMFCSGVDGGGIDTCQGDSGGPIVHVATNTLVGLVSFGIGCARPNYAGVNSRVSAAKEWIEQAKCEFSAYPLCNGVAAAALTPVPTAAPQPNVNHGSIVITLVTDDYPEEVSWTLMAGGVQNAMYFLPYEAILDARSLDTQQFDGLMQGVKYMFKISDMGGDGVCCSFGSGEVKIYDNVKGQDLWRGNFGAYYEIDFDILPDGQARLLDQSDKYKPSTWQDLENEIAPSNNPSWPGAMPSISVSSVVVNFVTDDYPEENSWELYRKQATSQWVLHQDWSGTTNSGYRLLVSSEISNLQEGWYHFIVRDSQGDGVCCSYGSGYVSLTGALAVNGGGLGLIWGNNGEFWAKDEVFFRVDNTGYISHITFAETATTEISRIKEEPESSKTQAQAP